MAISNEIESQKNRILDTLKNFLDVLQNQQAKKNNEIAKLQLLLRSDPKTEKSKIKLQLEATKKYLQKISKSITELEACQKKLAATPNSNTNALNALNRKIEEIGKSIMPFESKKSESFSPPRM